MSDGEKHTFIERAIADGYAELSGEGKTERVRYVAADRSERWSDPEEKVRAEFWAELIYKYDYSPDRIRLESVRRLHAGLQSFLSMRRIEARRKNASAFRLRFSQSLASLRQRLSHAMVRSTIQRLGKTTNPLT